MRLVCGCMGDHKAKPSQAHPLLQSTRWALVDILVDGALGVLHTSGMKTVNIVREALRKACATRPSDAWTRKLVQGTATDWVTRGHLNL